MVKQATFRSAAESAVRNIVRHGDTDIFPHSFERAAFYDKPEELVSLICDYNKNFDRYITSFPPSNVSALTPVSYFGFRWATQIDPIWNAYFLTCVIALADRIEAARVNAETVFSYRYRLDADSGDLFDRTYGWQQFMRKSLKRAEECRFVTTCDISEFYPRLGHHRLDNALRQVAGETEYPKKIMAFLSNFSSGRSFGLPIGGPAARLLSELTINQIDRLLIDNRIRFARFADDFHLFSETREEAYHQTILLSEKLFENQGLSLQKSKTRIMTAAEFKATSPIQLDDKERDANGREGDRHSHSRQLLNFSLRFDPYSPTAEDDYEALKREIKRFDIISLLKDELAKSRIHIALSRKILLAIRFLDGKTKDDAALSVMDNNEALYPIFSSALVMLSTVYNELGEATRRQISESIVKMIRDGSHVFRVDVHLCFALRVLQHARSANVEQLLKELFETRRSDIVRRDIILIMALWRDWYWLSDLKNKYRQLSGAERRAFLVASYALRDEGSHWRNHIKSELSPFEGFLLRWASERVNANKPGFPL